MKRLTLLLTIAALGLTARSQTLSLIPYPQSLTQTTGSVGLSLADHVTYQTCDTLANEEYRLSIREDGITITSSTEAGRFYALQTLEQLKLTSTDGTLPLVEISDKPLLAYRSFMLDCSRHFFTKEAVKRILKIMSFYKVNYFHWHLNDDQGWRVEIPEYPKLTSVGSIRKGSLTLKDNPYFYDDTEYGRGCYYTLDDLREVVKYADSLHIEIIPEYDLPGHNMAAIASYPELSCDSTKDYEVRIEEGVSTDVLNVGDDRVIDFLKCVLGHLAEVFPSKYMHLGGDECPTTVWQSNAMCQQRIKDEGLSSVDDLQPWLLEKLGSWLRDTYGKQVVCWDELVANWKTSYTIKPIIMCYSNASYASRACEAAAKGLKSIMTPTTPCYFDQMQCTTDQAEFGEIYQGGYGANWVNSVQSVYAFDPLAAYSNGGVSTDYCFGTQGSLWTEACCSEAEMQYQFLPRMLAVAENGWLPKAKKNWTNFKGRMQAHATILDSLGYANGKHYIDKGSSSAMKINRKEAKRLLDATVPGAVGYVSQAMNDSLQVAYDASFLEGAKSSALSKVVSAYKRASIQMPRNGELYQIRSASCYYLQRYLGSSLYLKDGAYRIHYTAQTEPEELWRCTLNDDQTYTFTSQLDGTTLKVSGSDRLTVKLANTSNGTYSYDPGVMMLQNGTSYLYANATGIVSDGTENRIGYPSSWRLLAVTDYTAWAKALEVKCEREVEAWKPATYGYRTAEAINYLKENVIAAISNRLQDTQQAVTEAEYETFVARYEQYLKMPVSSFYDCIDESIYYNLQNGYFTTAYASTSTQGAGNACNASSGTADEARWRFVKMGNGKVRVINKVNDRPAYVESSADCANVKVTNGTTTTYADYEWTIEQLTTDQNQTGIVIEDKTGVYSWYLNPSASTNVILRPRDWGASIWNMIPLKNDPTGYDGIAAPKVETTSRTIQHGTYDLNGRQHVNSHLQPKGIYIVNGRKVVK